MGKDITIIVNSCDSYSDLWIPFFSLFKRFWPDCKYPIILNTEHKNFFFEGLNVNVVNLPNNNIIKYGRRMKNVLKQVHSDYVLIMLDDFFIRSKVKSDVIEECKEWMVKDNSISLISFESVDDPLNKKDEDHPSFVLRPQFGEYKINLQAGLWRRVHLLKLISDNDSPWDFELLGNYRTFKSRLKYYALNPKSERVINYRKNDGKYPFKWSVVGGKWVVDTVVDLFNDNRILYDFSKRGIYDDTDYKRDQNPKIHYTKSQLIKSLGLILYLKIYKWGYIRKFSNMFLNRALPESYYEYKKNKIVNRM